MVDPASGSDRDLHEQRDRAVSFGSVAQLYDRARPTYPDALVRDLLTGDPRDVLDVGCGTGRAALLFAGPGRTVLGVEPDAAMADVARGHGLVVEVAGFEEWDDGGRRFDLLVSGQAWHWVDPEAGAAKARTVLRPGGRVGLFWNMDTMTGDDRAALDAAYETVAPQLMHRNRSYGGKRAPREPVLAALAGAGFAEVAQREYSWQRHYAAEDYVQLVQTFSDHNLLPPPEREALLAAVGDAVTSMGGLDITYECQLITALAP
ncbi:Ubiquinone/menaquinone biosynthesis C-methylase UbiE [Jatrophihabitans endophyticus]|uniref:Ubiquinone/menaquinone biosynthesis C-methylase UbiE n=1 Tax=Jatrophihabitans endophyticus TaxID=1206085 RepID=A0A1M5L611_9ACTN|nr:class I SAM-dependent methyltransferase [Jatrophihabitans endophyticus]SHG60431.1 Ubiquinone/menaquinone biosynthesis C-methylase UbiE [Jatrophihabitans endophyticus]